MAWHYRNLTSCLIIDTLITETDRKHFFVPIFTSVIVACYGYHLTPDNIKNPMPPPLCVREGERFVCGVFSLAKFVQKHEAT
jgi:hypothetical protein